ncbi:MAG: hypothetical protein AAF927_05355 [Bacteroidota bacterium]
MNNRDQSILLKTYLRQTVEDAKWLHKLRGHLQNNGLYQLPPSAMGGDPRSILVQGVKSQANNSHEVTKLTQSMESDLNALLKTEQQNVNRWTNYLFGIGLVTAIILTLILLNAIISMSLMPRALLVVIGIISVALAFLLSLLFVKIGRAREKSLGYEEERLRLKKLVLLFEMQQQHELFLSDQDYHNLL